MRDGVWSSYVCSSDLMVNVKNPGAAFGCSSVSLPSDRLGRYLHLVLFENSQDLFGPNFPELADLDDACLALFRDTLGGCRELDDEHFQAIEDLQRIEIGRAHV